MNAIGVLEARIVELRREEVELRTAANIIAATGLRTEVDQDGHLTVKVDKILVDPPEPDPPVDHERIQRRLEAVRAGR